MPKNNTSELKDGEKFNRLKILKFSHFDKRWRRWYFVKCDCGKEKIVMGSAMTSNNTRSCGCLQKETLRLKRISNNYSEITAIILGYKRHAKDRGLEWSLSRNFVETIIKKNCFYCGSTPSNIKKTKNTCGFGLFYSGIDRVNSNKNYTEDNVVPCCKICNYAKSNLTFDEFKSWAIKLGKKVIDGDWN